MTSNKKIAKNSILLYLRMAFVMLVNLYTVRVVLQALGAEDYGIYNVVAGVATMLTSISGVLSAATQRYYSYAIGEGDKTRLQNVFSASINIFLTISFCFILIGETVGLWFVNTQLIIPESRMVAANWIFQFALVSVIFSLLQTPFSAASIAHEDMYIFALISTIDCILKLIIALCMDLFPIDKLIFYGMSLSIVSFVSFLWYFITCIKKYKECSYHRVTEAGLHKSMLSFSGWTLITSGASIAMNQLVTIILNMFFGPLVNAARAIAVQVNSAICTFTGSFIMAVQPPMVKSYANKDYNRLNSLFYLSNKFIFFGLLMVCLPLFFEMNTVLSIWLGKVDHITVVFCQLMVIYSLILSLNNPISIIIQATGQMRKYVVPVESVTIITPIIVYLILKIGGTAENSLIVLIVMVSITHVIRLICLKRIYSLFSYKRYFKNFVIPALIILVIECILMLFLHYGIDAIYLRLCLSLFISVIATITLSWFFALSHEEMSIILNLIKRNNNE